MKPEAPKAPEAPAAIHQLATDKTSIREAYLDPSSAITGQPYHSATTLKLAFIKFAADAAGFVGQTQTRIEFCKLLDRTPSWLGCGNNSACKAAFENAKPDTATQDFSKW